MKTKISVNVQTSGSEEDTGRIGLRLAENLKPGDAVYFYGGLGCGKTVMIKGIAEGFGIPPEIVNSPTFVLMNVYRGMRGNVPVNISHFDFYRLGSLREIEEIGFWEYRDDGETVCLVEWAERLGESLAGSRWEVRLSVSDDGLRNIAIEYISADGILERRLE